MRALVRARELAGFADGDEAGAQPGGDGHAVQEAARLDADHAVDVPRDVGDRMQVELQSGDERLRVAQHGRDVAEQDPGLGEVGDRGHQVLDAGQVAGDPLLGQSEVHLTTPAAVASPRRSPGR